MAHGGCCERAGPDVVEAGQVRWRVWVAALVVAFEIAPFAGGFVRYGGFAALLAATRRPTVAVGFLAGSTFVTELLASVGMGYLLSIHRVSALKGVNLIDRSVGRFIPSGRRVRIPAKLVVLNYLGSASLVYATSREKPERGFRDHWRLGFVASASLAVACAVQGYCIAYGLGDPTNPKVVVPALAALVVGLGLMNLMKRRVVGPAREDGLREG